MNKIAALTAATALGAFTLDVSIHWIVKTPVVWAVRRTRYGPVDQRWIIPIGIFVDTLYVALGLGGQGDAEYWVGMMIIAPSRRSLSALYWGSCALGTIVEPAKGTAHAPADRRLANFRLQAASIAGPNWSGSTATRSGIVMTIGCPWSRSHLALTMVTPITRPSAPKRTACPPGW
jgi:hypothetical protein